MVSPGFPEERKSPMLKRCAVTYGLSLKQGMGNRGIRESGNRGIGESGNRGIRESGNPGIGESGNHKLNEVI